MKLRYLAVLLLTIAFAPNAAYAACDSMKPYLQELSAGHKPAAPPEVKECPDGPDTDAVASALTAFISAKSTSAADFDVVFEQLRTTYEKNKWPHTYAALADALDGRLPGYKHHTPDYALLDTLPNYFEQKHPRQPKADPPRWRFDIVVTQEPFPWVLWGILGVAILLAPIPAVATLRLRQTLHDAKAEEDELTRRLASTSAKFDTALQRLNDDLQAIAGTLGAKVGQVSLLKVEHFEPVSAAIGNLREDLARLGDTVEEFATKPSRSGSDPVALEHQVLGESWKQFSGNPLLRAGADDAAGSAAWEPLLDDLPKHIPPDLQSSFETVYAPCKEHRVFVKKLALIPRILERKISRLPTDAEELRRTRELAALLATAQNGAEGANPLNFRFKRWVTDTFLPFADLFFQRCQQADMEKRGDELQAGANLVRQLLLLASVEAIEVKLGETPFDSTRHIGRGTTNDPRFADGVITGVVRNGFIEGGKQVIRQPEVIVNRMR
ncbi:MAG TPA: hypothetical protein VN380_17010 [Thermoanaerobaculia bacterium]|jgi:molecular chaperone GrpE (heat shock protein)|nr:hypothetical protein [Thermoanaerobaculia bacterium]